jgi:hypothetical protein
MKGSPMRLATLSCSIRIRSLGVVLVGLLSLVSAASAHAEVIFDSITGNTATGSTTATVNGWKAAQFILPAASGDKNKFGLGSVVLNLVNNPLATNFTVEIYDSTGGTAKPNSRIGELVATQPIVVGNNEFFTTNSFPTLNAASSYWVVLKGGASSPQWGTAGNTGLISPISQQGTSTALTTNGGTSWLVNPAANNPSMMTVNAVAVPEPSTWAMGLAGLGFAGFKVLGRRRRQG